jgi:hypothetical protein
MLKFKEGREDYVKYFRNYLKHFYAGKVFTTRRYIKDIDIICDENINVHLLTSLLLRNDIISNVDNEEVTINERYKSKIIKFLTATFPFPELKKCVKQLEAYLMDTIDTTE